MACMSTLQELSQHIWVCPDRETLLSTTGVRHQCLQQSRSIVETEFLGGDSALSSATLEMLEDEQMTEVLTPFPSHAQAGVADGMTPFLS